MKTELDVEMRRADPRTGSGQAPRQSRYLFAGVAVSSIWLGVAIASIWSPDMITGSEHEHIPIAAFVDGLYAALATGLVLMAFSRRTPDASRALWVGFSVAIASIWGGWRSRASTRRAW